MASNEPYSTIEELPDFDIEFPEGSFDPETEEEDDLDALPYEDDDRDWSDQDNFPYHELDDIVDAQWEDQQGLDHPINWLG
jgi:hypothetical protein|tara:strand:+ start:195 stop:437 length:243 start_codon:yes stop_codon:yes gene_type:complete